MKKVVMAALALVLAVSAASAQSWLTGPVEDALAKAKAQGKLLLLDFFQESG
jgi:carbohydrate-selective porin OprB